MFETEDALYFASGYMGNAILLQGLNEDNDVVFYDADSHYSVRDAVALSGKPAFTFAYRDADDLKTELARCLKPSQRPLVFSDGVFPIQAIASRMKDANNLRYEPILIL